MCTLHYLLLGWHSATQISFRSSAPPSPAFPASTPVSLALLPTMSHCRLLLILTATNLHLILLSGRRACARKGTSANPLHTATDHCFPQNTYVPQYHLCRLSFPSILTAFPLFLYTRTAPGCRRSHRSSCSVSVELCLVPLAGCRHT